MLLFFSYCPLLQHLHSHSAWAFCFRSCLSKVPLPKKSSLLWLGSSHKPEQAPPTVFCIISTGIFAMQSPLLRADTVKLWQHYFTKVQVCFQIRFNHILCTLCVNTHLLYGHLVWIQLLYCSSKNTDVFHWMANSTCFLFSIWLAERYCTLYGITSGWNAPQTTCFWTSIFSVLSVLVDEFVPAFWRV